MHYLIIRPSTGETMGQDRYGLLVIEAGLEQPTYAPKLLTTMHVAENHQSAMNCEFGTGWEVATLDLAKGIVAITVTESVD